MNINFTGAAIAVPTTVLTMLLAGEATSTVTGSTERTDKTVKFVAVAIIFASLLTKDPGVIGTTILTAVGSLYVVDKLWHD